MAQVPNCRRRCWDTPFRPWRTSRASPQWPLRWPRCQTTVYVHAHAQVGTHLAGSGTHRGQPNAFRGLELPTCSFVCRLTFQAVERDVVLVEESQHIDPAQAPTRGQSRWLVPRSFLFSTVLGALAEPPSIFGGCGDPGCGGVPGLCRRRCASSFVFLMRCMCEGGPTMVSHPDLAEAI